MSDVQIGGSVLLPRTRGVPRIVTCPADPPRNFATRERYVRAYHVETASTRRACTHFRNFVIVTFLRSSTHETRRNVESSLLFFTRRSVRRRISRPRTFFRNICFCKAAPRRQKVSETQFRRGKISIPGRLHPDDYVSVALRQKHR